MIDPPIEPMDQYLKDDNVHNVVADVKSHGSDAIEIGGKGKKKRDASTLRKAPQAPKRFKSSYIMFFMAKQQEIKAELGVGTSVGDVSKESSDRWKKLSVDDRAVWDQKAKADKERYNLEKASYTGPWQVPWKRAKKDPNAPKRPMSAFLFFSQDKRRMIKGENPGMRNTEISRVLGEMWKNASDEEKAPHIEREARERAKYKINIAKWRKEDLVRKEDAKKEQIEQQAKLATRSQLNHQLPPSTVLSTDDSQSYSSQHSYQVHTPSQGLSTQQYYHGNFGYSDYQVPTAQGYGQPSQYYDNSIQQDQGAYYNTIHDPHSEYHRSPDNVYSSDLSSKYSVSNRTSDGASQYTRHHDMQQASGYNEAGYFPPQQMQGHLHSNAVTSYQGEYDAYSPHHAHASQSPTLEHQNYNTYHP